MSYRSLETEDTATIQRKIATTVAAEISTAYLHLIRAQRETKDIELLNKLNVAMREVQDALNKAEALKLKP